MQSVNDFVIQTGSQALDLPPLSPSMFRFLFTVLLLCLLFTFFSVSPSSELCSVQLRYRNRFLGARPLSLSLFLLLLIPLSRTVAMPNFYFLRVSLAHKTQGTARYGGTWSPSQCCLFNVHLRSNIRGPSTSTSGSCVYELGVRLKWVETGVRLKRVIITVTQNIIPSFHSL